MPRESRVLYVGIAIAWSGFAHDLNPGAGKDTWKLEALR